MRPPFLLPCVSLCAGIVLARAGASLPEALVLIAAGLAIYFLLLRMSGTPVGALRASSGHLLWPLFLFAGIGITDAYFHSPETLPATGAATTDGRIMSKVTTTSGEKIILEPYRILTASGHETHPANLRVILYSDPTTANRGDIITARGVIEPITDSPNRLPTGYSDRMKREGILYTMKVRSSDDRPDITVSGHRGSLQHMAEDIRDNIEIFIEHTSLKRDTKNFLITLLLGDKAFLDEETRQTFADAGVAHVLALSGMHVGIIIMFLMIQLFPLNFLGGYRARYLLVILFLWCYAFLAGLSPTIVRASVMATFAMGGIAFQRKNSSMNSLCGAVFLLVLIEPWCIFNIGMQLSVVCVASLIIFADNLNPVSHHDRPTLHKISAALITTMTATGATWVLTAYYFRQFPLMFLPMNLIVLPLLPWFTGAAVTYLAAAAAGADSATAAKAIDLCYDSFHSLTVMTGESAVVNISVGDMTVIMWFAAMALLGIGLYSNNPKKRRRWLIGGTAAVGVCLATIPVFKSGIPEGYIIQERFDSIGIMVYSDGEERLVEMPRGEISTITTAGERIVVIDCEAEDSEIPDETVGVDIAVIGSNFKGELDDVAERFRPGKIVMHPSVYSKREESMRAGYTGTVPVYSLRSEGPLHRFRE